MKKFSRFIGFALIAGIAIMANLLYAANPSYTAPTNSGNVIVQADKVISSDTLYVIHGTSDSAFILKGYSPRPGFEFIWAHPAWTTGTIASSRSFIYYLQAKDAASNVLGSVNVDTQTVSPIVTERTVYR